MVKCRICNVQDALQEGSTCGGSYCQESAHHFNRANNARRNSAGQREAFKVANEVQEKAISWAKC